MLPSGQEERQAAIIKVVATPTPGQGPKSNARKGFFRTIGALLGLCRDYSAEDIGRLKEAGVRIVEVKSELAGAEATERLAQAAKLHAEAEVARAEARLKNAQANDIEQKSKIENLNDLADAYERVQAAISRIKQQGGEVSFDKRLLGDQLRNGLSEFPDDHLLRDAERKLLDE